MQSYDSAKKLVVDTAQKLTQKGYLVATGGNVSVRILQEKAFAITPSNYDYMKMRPEDVCVLDFELNVLEGQAQAVGGKRHALRNLSSASGCQC